MLCPVRARALVPKAELKHGRKAQWAMPKGTVVGYDYFRRHLVVTPSSEMRYAAGRFSPAAHDRPPGGAREIGEEDISDDAAVYVCIEIGAEPGELQGCFARDDQADCTRAACLTDGACSPATRRTAGPRCQPASRLH